jgi:hypothetical protein
VIRSLLTLKALTFAETGVIVDGITAIAGFEMRH